MSTICTAGPVMYMVSMLPIVILFAIQSRLFLLCARAIVMPNVLGSEDTPLTLELLQGHYISSSMPQDAKLWRCGQHGMELG